MIIFSLLLEINSETDFVSKNQDFQNFVDNILDIGIKKKHTIDSLLEAQYSNNETVAVALQNLVAKIGENIVIRRLSYLDADLKIQYLARMFIIKLMIILEEWHVL